MRTTASKLKVVAALALAALVTAGCERPPVDEVQGGYRGTGMVQMYNPRDVAKEAAGNGVPEPLAGVPGGRPARGTSY